MPPFDCAGQTRVKKKIPDTFSPSYPDLVADPAPVIEKLAALLPGRFTPSPAVAACVKPKLYRNRGTAEAAIHAGGP